MANKDDQSELKKPVSPTSQAVVRGVAGGGIMAAFEFGWQALMNWAHERKQSFSKNRIVDLVLAGTLFGAYMGYRDGQQEVSEYTLKKQNAELKNTIESISSPQVQSVRPYTEVVVASKEATGPVR